MNNSSYEALSALLDNAHERPAALLKKISASPELKAKWAAHYKTRALLQGEFTPLLDSGFADRVSAAIDKEPAILAPCAAKPRDPQPAPWKKPALGLAIAATVAALSVLGLNNFSTQQPLMPPLTPMASAPTAETTPQLAEQLDGRFAEVSALSNENIQRVSLTLSAGTHWDVERVDNKRDPALEKRLNMYLADHMEFASSSKVQGMLPYSRLVGYDTPE